MLSSKPFTFRIAARKADEFAPPQAFCTGVTRSSAASTGAGRGRVFSQVPNRSTARFARSQSRSKTRPLATSASVTAAVASASSRIRLPDDQRSGRASSRWRATKSGRASTSPSMKTRNSASEVAIARLRIAFLRKPSSSCRTCRTASPGCAAAKASTTAFVSGPDPSSAMATPPGGTACPATDARQSSSARGFS